MLISAHASPPKVDGIASAAHTGGEYEIEDADEDRLPTISQDSQRFNNQTGLSGLI